MIETKELSNREYAGKECVGFTYSLIDKDDGSELMEARFKKIDPISWRCIIIFEKTPIANSQLYDFTFQLPKESILLNKICAIGLLYFQNNLKNEVQNKTIIDFAIGSKVGDM